MTDETHYSLLEVSEDASALEIRAAYRRLMLDVHPDRLANAPVYWQRLAEEKSKQINAAFAVLSDIEKRRRYDAKLRSDRATQNNVRAKASTQPSSPPSGNPGRHQSHGYARSESGSGARSRSAPYTPPRDQRSQANSSSAPHPSGVPKAPSQLRFSGVGPRERLFFSLILALFSFGAAVDFWEATSAGEGLVMFILASALLFAIACLYHRRISRSLSAIHLSRPRHQLWATIGAIVLILFMGKITHILQQSSAEPPSRSVPDSGANSSILLKSGDYEDAPAAPVAAAAPAGSSLSAEQVMPVSLPNGTEILKRRRNGGHGKFTVDNGTAEDAVVELVNIETKKAIRAFYVESGKKFTEDHIGPGTYSIYYMTGVGWDASARQFSRRGECDAFDQTATFSEQRDEESGKIEVSEFTITLHPVVGGTAHTSGLDSGEFSRAIAGADSQ
jgi:hypothetical protein